MQWTFGACVLMSIAIAVSTSDRLRHKRSLSFISRLLSNGMESSQRKCTKSQGKPTQQYEIVVVPSQIIIVEPVPDITRRIKNNEDNHIINSIERFFASDTFQATAQAVGNMISTLLTRVLTKETRPQRPQYATGLICKSTVTTIPENFRNTKIVYNRPRMPRKYYYEQIKDETVQKFFLDKNSDVIVTETKKQLPRPMYVNDRIKDVILGAPSNTHRFYSSIDNEKIDEASVKSDMAFSENRESFDVNMLASNDIPLYTGNPIVILGDTTKNMRTSASTPDYEITSIPEHNIKEQPRGDIPAYMI